MAAIRVDCQVLIKLLKEKYKRYDELKALLKERGDKQ